MPPDPDTADPGLVCHRMKLIGLTGGIACGKSTVSRFLLTEFGTPIIDLDAISHSVLQPGSFTHSRVVGTFGAEILTPEGSIDRKRLGALVFGDRALRRRLEAIQQPAIALRLLGALLYHFLVGTDVVVLDAALLYETGLHRICSVVVAVFVDDATQLSRLLARDRAGEDDARARLAAQPIAAREKAARAHVGLPNDSDEAALQQRLRQLAPSLLRPSSAQRIACAPSLLLLAAATSLGWSALGRASAPPVSP